jgi:uncharacterized coiled-coil protein SlyX
VDPEEGGDIDAIMESLIWKEDAPVLSISVNNSSTSDKTDSADYNLWSNKISALEAKLASQSTKVSSLEGDVSSLETEVSTLQMQVEKITVLSAHVEMLEAHLSGLEMRLASQSLS